MLKYSPKADPTIKAGKFGRCGKMIIKAYSIPDEYRDRLIKTFNQYTRIDICGCWLWQGRVHNGYGVFPTHDSSRWAHRVVYALFNGPIDEGMHIDHRCRRRICVNPEHLRMVTPIENYMATQRRRLRDEKELKEEMGQLTLW